MQGKEMDPSLYLADMFKGNGNVCKGIRRSIQTLYLERGLYNVLTGICLLELEIDYADLF